MESPFAGAGPSFAEDAAPRLLDAFRRGCQGLLGPNSGQCSGRSSLDESLLQAVAGADPRTAAAGFGGGGLGSGHGLLRSATVANPLNMAEILAQTGLLAAAGSAVASLNLGGSAGPVGSSTQQPVAWVHPSGRRTQGEGCEDVEQAVLLAVPTQSGGALLRITLLAAGFCIGPSGASIRDVCKASQTDIKSWTAPPDEQCNRSCRMFRVEGPRHGVAKAVGIICDAVDRYKELCEGKYAGQSVARLQHVSGVDFHYQPPPRQVVPFAASLKGQSCRRQGSGQGGKQASGGRPPTAPHSHRGKGISASRSGSLGTPPPSAVPSPSQALSRSASVPTAQQAPLPGSGSGGTGGSTRGVTSAGLPPIPPHRGGGGSGHPHPARARGDTAQHSSCNRRSEEKPQRAAEGSAESTLDATPAGSTNSNSGSAASAGSTSAVESFSTATSRPSPLTKLKRSASDASPAAAAAQLRQEAGQQAAAPLAPAQKLGKDDVLRSVFGGEGTPVEAAVPAATDQLQQGLVHHLPQQPQQLPAQRERYSPSPAVSAGSFDISVLLQQLALQEAQEQATAALALAAQQSVRGGYELSEPGVLLPASLSPLARPLHQVPMSAADTHLAAQSLAINAEMLAAVAAAWKNAQEQQQQQQQQQEQVASRDQLLQLAAAGLLGPLGQLSMPSGMPSGSTPPPALPPGVPTSAGPHASTGFGRGSGSAGTQQAQQEEAEAHMPLSAFQSPFFSPTSTIGGSPASQAQAGSGSTSPALGAFCLEAGSPPGRRGSVTGTGHLAAGARDHAGPATPEQPRPAADAAAALSPPGGSAAPERGAGGTDGFGGTTSFASGAPLPDSGPGLLRGHQGGGHIPASPCGSFGALPSLLPVGSGSSALGSAGLSGMEESSLPHFGLGSGPFQPLGEGSLGRAASVPGPEGSCTPLDRLTDMLSLARANSYAAPGGPAGGAHSSTGLVVGGPPGPSAFSSAFSPSRHLPEVAPPLGAGRLSQGSGGGGGSLADVDFDNLLESMF